MPDAPSYDALADFVASAREDIRTLQDRALKLETFADGLNDKHDTLRTEVRSEIASLRSQITSLETKMDTANRQINSKLDRLFGARAVVTTLITLSTSIIGSGVVHLVVSIGK
ncbi:hypothetical protein JK207_00535 [Gluconobacter cerinus]|uniref:hypothetical protein n=1 Tax=Gluconobacter cerinus TaxID=38307 RepID=UPI001B8CEAD3|nr:hypothetical protein [Gluconobacter cerinus]MBS1020522.1 hypothetical protein [Gluconobacter cerinus]